MVAAIVIDNGSAWYKAGFYGNSLHGVIFPTVVERPKNETSVKKEEKILQRNKRISTFEDEGIRCLMCVWTAQKPCVYEMVTCSRGEVCGQVTLKDNTRYNGCLHQSLCLLTRGKCCQDPLCNWMF